MIEILEQHQSDLAELCRRYHVARLEVFGSAASGRFDPSSSDLDFLVDFQPQYPQGSFRQYFDFLLDLKKLFGREVDLVETIAMKNPYFIQSANQNKVLLYAA